MTRIRIAISLILALALAGSGFAYASAPAASSSVQPHSSSMSASSSEQVVVSSASGGGAENAENYLVEYSAEGAASDSPSVIDSSAGGASASETAGAAISPTSPDASAVRAVSEADTEVAIAAESDASLLDAEVAAAQDAYAAAFRDASVGAASSASVGSGAAEASHASDVASADAQTAPAAGYDVGGTFQAQTAEGVAVTYLVLAAAQAGASGRVQVGMGTLGSPAVPNGVAGSITIPATVTDPAGGVYQVRSVGAYAFANSPSYGVRTTSIRAVALPATVQSIGTSAFRDCVSLASVDFGHDSLLVSLPTSCFYGCTALSSIELPFRLSSIGHSAFSGCSSLAELSLPDTLQSIGAWAFANAGCTSVAFDAALREIGEGAFSGSSLQSVVLPASLEQIGARAFQGCTALATADVSAPALYALSESCFSGCTALASVSLGSTVETVSRELFAGCLSLARVDIPATVRSIEPYAFRNCTALSRLEFLGDASAVSADETAFVQATGIAQVVFRGPRGYDLDFAPSTPALYCTVTFRGLDGTMAGTLVAKVGSIPASATGDEVLEGAIPDAPAGSVWVADDGYSLRLPLSDSYGASTRVRERELAVGDTFSAVTADLVTASYRVTSLDAATGTGTVELSSGSTGTTAIPTDTGGSLTLPDTVVGPDACTYTVAGICASALEGCAQLYGISIPSHCANIGARAFAGCTLLGYVEFRGDADTFTDRTIFAGCAQISCVVFGGASTDMAFGVSVPDIYYTVSYYRSRADMASGILWQRAVVLEGSVLDALNPGELLRGSVPNVARGWELVYPDGIGPALPLEASAKVYRKSAGMSAPVTLRTSSGERMRDCTFQVIAPATDEACGEVWAGLGEADLRAVSTGATGILVMPEYVSDEDGKRYRVTGIAAHAFGSADEQTACINLTGIELPDSIAFIGEGAFENCSALLSVSLGAGLTEIAEGAFRDCRQLVSANLAGCTSLECIGQEAFYRCSYLEDIAVPAAVREIGLRAFGGCSSVKSIEFLGDAGEIQASSGIINASFYLGGALRQVVYRGSKARFTIRGANEASLFFPSGYRSYYTVDFYASTADRAAGVSCGSALLYNGSKPDALRTGDVLEGSVPACAAWQTWVEADGGNAGTAGVSDSCDMVRRADVGFATAAFEQSNYAYEGVRLTPVPSVTLPDGTRLQEGRDFTVGGYENNNRPGEASCTVTGIGDCTGTLEASFTIVKYGGKYGTAKLGSPIDPFVYTGRAWEPDLGVVNADTGEALVRGADYELSYASNVDAGTATVAATGIGDWSFSLSSTFRIDPCPLSSCTVLGLGSAYAYSGNAVVPDIAVTGPNGQALVQGVDYELSAMDNVEVGTATMVLAGRGNYTGILTYRYTIAIGGGGQGGSGGSGNKGTGTGGAGDAGNGTTAGADGSGMALETSNAGNVGLAAQEAGAPSEGAEGGNGLSIFELKDVGGQTTSLPILQFLAVLALMLLAFLAGGARMWRSFRRMRIPVNDEGRDIARRYGA